jgi:hypothetical protein
VSYAEARWICLDSFVRAGEIEVCKPGGDSLKPRESLRSSRGLGLAATRMNGLLNLNLIHFLDFYFSFLFFLGTYRRIKQYQEFGKLALACPSRWPRLLKLIHEHRMIFLTWGTVLPLLLTLLLMLVQLIASRFVWPEAGEPPDGLTVNQLLHHWIALPLVGPLGLAMVAFDLYTLVRVGVIDRALAEKYFDQAEYWLGSGTAHVVRVVTFGYVNPRKMVAEEVRKALVTASEIINFSLWWTNLQVGLRFAFGLSLWLTWALAHRAV